MNDYYTTGKCGQGLATRFSLKRRLCVTTVTASALVQELRNISELYRKTGEETCQEHSKCPLECLYRKMGHINISDFGAHLCENSGYFPSVDKVEEFFSEFGEFPMLARRIARHRHTKLLITMKGRGDPYGHNMVEEFKRVAGGLGFNISNENVITVRDNQYFELIISW